MSGRIEDERPVKSKSPDVLGVVEIVGMGIVRREWVVERWESWDFVVDRDAVVGHWAGFAPTRGDALPLSTGAAGEGV